MDRLTREHDRIGFWPVRLDGPLKFLMAAGHSRDDLIGIAIGSGIFISYGEIPISGSDKTLYYGTPVAQSIDREVEPALAAYRDETGFAILEDNGVLEAMILKSTQSSGDMIDFTLYAHSMRGKLIADASPITRYSNEHGYRAYVGTRILSCSHLGHERYSIGLTLKPAYQA